jgi:hypothetical protein
MKIEKRKLTKIMRTIDSNRIKWWLIVITSIVVLVAAVLQAKHGRPYSQWFIYRTAWFTALLLTLAASLICAVVSNKAWRLNRIAFLMCHVGMLLLIAGLLITSWFGYQAEMILSEGESTDRLTLDGRYQITATWPDRPKELPYVFQFEAGPVDWREGTQLDVGTVDDIRACVLNYYHRGEAIANWSIDDSNRGGPLVRFVMEGADDSRVAHYLTDQDFGAELFFGPIAIRLQRASNEAMVADFLQPTNPELSEKGLLTMYYQGHVKRAIVDDHVGQTITLGEEGATVELVHYLADAKLDATGKFKPLSDQPKNPLVELRVHVPNEKEPFRQVAFAKSPLLNFDGVYDRVCPVKFVYKHPAVIPATAIELLQTSDGKLYGRITADGQTESSQEITAGSRLNVPGGFTFLVSEYLPHAQCEISFKPAKENAQSHDSSQPAVELQVETADASEKVWLQCNQPQRHRQSIETAKGELLVHFGRLPYELGFSLQLVDLYDDWAKGSPVAGLLRVIDREDRAFEQEVAKTTPLCHRGFKIVPVGPTPTGHGKPAAVFQVLYAPGSDLQYAGVWLIIAGAAASFSQRAFLLHRAKVGSSTRQ